MSPASPEQSTRKELSVEMNSLRDSWDLSHIDAFDPSEIIQTPSMTAHQLITELVKGSTLAGANISANPWPFSDVTEDIIPTTAKHENWSTSFTQYPNLILLESPSCAALLFCFQFIDDHFKALLSLALIVRETDSLVLSLPKWRGKLSREWENEYESRLSNILPADVSSKQLRHNLFKSIDRRRSAIVDTYANRHPGNYLMNDLGPAISIFSLIKNSSGCLRLARTNCGWFSEEDELELIQRSRKPSENIIALSSTREVEKYCEDNSHGLLKIWGSNVPPELPVRVKEMLKSRHACAENPPPTSIEIGIGVRSRDRRLLNIDEVVASIIQAFPKSLWKSFHFIVHGSAKGIWLSDDQYFLAEHEQANNIKAKASAFGAKVSDIIGLPLVDQLAKLSSIQLDIVPVGVVQVKSLFYLRKPQIIHSPLGVQPIEHKTNPWLTVANLTYTAIWRGVEHEKCLFLPKVYVNELIDSSPTGNPGRFDYKLDPTRVADVVYGFWGGNKNMPQ